MTTRTEGSERPRAPLASEPEEALAPGRGEQLRVLLADDDEIDRMAVRRAAKAAGMDLELVEVPDATEALARLSSEAFDCALLDFQMPKRDGLWVLVEARRAGVDTPVIMLTGQGDEQTAVDLIKAGASDYIPKSALSPKRLKSSLRQAVRLSRAERQLRASEAAREREARIVRTIAENTTSALYMLDGGGRCTFMNRAAERMTGYAQAEVEGRLLHDVLHPFRPDGSPFPASECTLCPREGAEGETAPVVRDHEDVFLRKEGAFFPVLCAARPIVEGGRRVSTVMEVRDVTDQKRQEAEARRRAEFEQQLIAIVSHDLRNPLQVIQLSANFLLRSEDVPDRLLKPLRRIASTTDRMARMIGQLLDFTQARVGGGIPIHREAADLHEIARQVVEDAAVAHPARGIALERSGSGGGAFDADRMVQVLQNLLENAVAHSPDGSAVRVRSFGEGTEIGFEVQNENAGDPISPELMSCLFEPYRRGAVGSNARTKSVGLGLYIVDQIVRAHGGTVVARSTREEGTVFAVRLPRGEGVREGSSP